MGYEDVSFPDNDFLIIPVCVTGIYAFAENMPLPLIDNAPTDINLTNNKVAENKPVGTRNNFV